MGIIHNMNMRKRTFRQKLGFLVITAMLFTQSALLWAQVMNPPQAQHHLQQDCHGHQTVVADSGQQQCKQDCCDHEHSCSGQCSPMCVTAGANLLPVAMINLLPLYQKSSPHFSLLHSPDGMHVTVLDRPPRNYA